MGVGEKGGSKRKEERERERCGWCIGVWLTEGEVEGRKGSANRNEGVWLKLCPPVSHCHPRSSFTGNRTGRVWVHRWTTEPSQLSCGTWQVALAPFHTNMYIRMPSRTHMHANMFTHTHATRTHTRHAHTHSLSLTLCPGLVPLAWGTAFALPLQPYSSLSGYTIPLFISLPPTLSLSLLLQLDWVSGSSWKCQTEID